MGTKLKVDVAYIIDTTASMGSLIRNAKDFMVKSIQGLRNTGVDLRVSLIVYRDHPPQEHTFASKVLVNMGTNTELKKAMSSSHFSPRGGGDAPESGFDGIQELNTLKWRNEALHYAFIIADAPLHGTLRYGRVIKGERACTCGLTKKDIKLTLESTNTQLIGVVVSAYDDTVRSFKEITEQVNKTARSSANTGMTVVTDYIKSVHTDVQCAIDKVLPVLQADPFMPNAEVAKQLDMTVMDVTRYIETLNLIGATDKLCA